MMRKAWLLSLLAAILVTLSIFTLNIFGKEENRDSKSDIRIISEKIEKVLKNQDDIIERLKDIRQELDIIRVRASRR